MNRLIRTTSFVCTLALAAGAAWSENVTYDPELFEAMEWRSIGPFRGGRSVAATGVASEPRTYYFGSVGGGVWKTTDAGEIWRNVSEGFLATSSVGAITVAPSDPNVIYVGMGEHAVRGVMTSHGDGVYRSTDAGRSWQHVGLASSRAISRIRVHPTDPDLVYVAAQGAPYGRNEERGIYRSRDGGETWDLLLFISDAAGAADLAMDPRNPRILYAAFWDHERKPWEVRSGGEGSGIHKSTDAGETWTKLTKGLPETLGKLSVDVSADSDRLYAIVEADPGGGLYRSDDSGESWQAVNETWGIRSRAWYYIEVFADPNNADVVWVMNARAWKSVDGGKTFEQVRTPHGDNHDLWINPNDSSTMINANDGGANVSFDGGETWSTQRNQPTAQFYRVNTDNQFPYRVYGGQQDNSSVSIASRSFGSGIGWSDFHSVGGCETSFNGFDPDDPKLVYSGCYMGIITEWNAATRSSRGVQAYVELPAALPAREMKYRFNWNAPILVSQHDRSVVYHAGNVVLKSTDRGDSWTEISPDLTMDDDEKQGPGGRPITNEGAGGETYNTIAYLAESPHDAGTLWAGTDDGLVQLTRDGGATWSNVTPKGYGEALVNAVEVSPHDPATAYIAVTRYEFNDFTPLAYKTTDYGVSWTSIAGGLPEDSWVRVVREDPVRSDLLYMGTETAVHVSWDGGKSWSPLQLNLPVTPITDLKVQSQSNDLVAATGGRSFWILDDLSPLQQLAGATSADQLVEPRRTVRTYAGGFGPGGRRNPRLGQNPPVGAIIDYWLEDVPEKLEIEIVDGAGNVIRHYVGETEAAEGGAQEGERKSRGRRSRARRHEEGAQSHQLGPSSRDGHEGAGRLRLRIAARAQSRPRLLPCAIEDRRGELRGARRGHSRPPPRRDRCRLRGSGRAIGARCRRRGRDPLRRQSPARRARSDRGARREDRRRRCVGRGDEDPHGRQGARGKPHRSRGRLDSKAHGRRADCHQLPGPAQPPLHLPTERGGWGRLGTTQGARQRFADLQEEWAEQKTKLDDLLGEKMDAFNQLVRDEGVPAIDVARKDTSS